MIEFKNVSFKYNAKSSESTLKGINLKIEKGEFAAIIGSNGAGKSTISKMINGLLKPSDGDVIIDGMNTKKVSASRIAKKVGYLFQNPDRQICCDTIEKELSFGLNVIGMAQNEISERVNAVIEEFKFDGKENPFSLSRGERQRIALASIIALKPDVIILDEPTTGLDYLECTHIMDKITELNKSGVTVVIICHDMELVYDYASRVIVMADGEVVADGNSQDVFRNTEKLRIASIIPPQIIELAVRLGDGFENTDTVCEMVAAITERRNAV